MNNPAYNKKYNLRLPQEVFDKIEQIALQYDRSVNEQIVYMLKTWQEPTSLEDRLSRIEAALLPAISKKAVGQ